MYCTDYWLNNFYAVFIAFLCRFFYYLMHFVLFADVSPDELQGETDSCVSNVCSIVVQIDILRL